MELEFTYANGMVRIKDVQAPATVGQLDFSAPAGDFYTMLSTDPNGDASRDSMTIYHASGRPITSFGSDEVTVPSGADFTVLKPLIDAILSQSTEPTMTPKSIVFVSGQYGSPTGNGSLADPIDTIAAGIAIADTNAAADNIQWEVHVLGGEYDEQIAPNGPNLIFVKLRQGCNVTYSGIGPTVNDSLKDVNLYMDQGAILSNTGGGAVFSANGNSTTVFGHGSVMHDAIYPVVEVSAGEITATGIRFLNVAPTPSELFNVSGGTLRLTDCVIVSSDTTTPILKSGGTINLQGCSIMSAASEYADAPGPDTIQVVNCVSNVPAGMNITETVGTMLVDPAYQV